MEVQNKIFTKRFLMLFLTNVSIFMVFYGLVSVLPLYVTGTLGRTDDDAGLLVTVFLVSAIIVRPFSGKLLDIYGKKKLLLISGALYVICNVFYLLVEPFVLLLALRFMQGIWFSIATTAVGSLAADSVPMNRKGAGLGYFGMSTNLAVVLGPMIGILIIQAWNFDMLFIILSSISLIGWLIALTIDTAGLPVAEKVEKKWSFSLDDLFEKKALRIASLAALMSFSYSSVLSFISLYAEQKDMLSIASYFYAVFAIIIILSRPFTGKIYDQYGPKYVMIPAYVLFAAGLILLAYMTTSWQFIVAAIVIGLGYGTLTTSMQSQAVQATSPKRSGYATATYFTLFDVGIALGSFVLGIVAVMWDYKIVYIICAVLLIVNLLLYQLSQKKYAH